MENEQGFRPVENASKQGAYRLMMAFFNTTKVYLTKVETANAFMYKYYDITDYECCHSSPRLKQSPLTQLVYADKGRFDQDTFVSDMFNPNEMVSMWVRNKIRVNRPLAALWFIVRSTYFFGFMSYDSDERWVKKLNGISSGEAAVKNLTYNGSHFIYCSNFSPFPFNTTSFDLLYFLVFYCACAAAIDVYDIITIARDWTYWKNLRYSLHGRKNTVDRSLWFRLCNFISVNICMSSVIYLRFIATSRQEYIGDILRIIVVVTGFWAALYLIQTLPKIGYFVVIIQRMLSDVSKFLVLFSFIVLPFSYTLLVFMNTNSKQGCVKEFSGYFQSMYSVVKIMQNILDPSTFSVENENILLLCHVALIFFMSILMLNFLIAILSSSVSYLSVFADAISSLQNLEICHAIEIRFRHFMKAYYTYMVKRCFVTENDRVFLVTTVPITAETKLSDFECICG